ncbi:MAG: aminotransferase class IV [Opitutales bacterium]
MSSIEIILPGESLRIEPGSSGFAHGFGLFETMRLSSGRLELWGDHWARLCRSARELGLSCKFEEGEVLQAVRELARVLPTEALVKLSLLKTGQGSTLYVYSRSVSSLPEAFGLLLDYSAPINEASPLAGHKTHNYLENLLALEAARQVGCYDALRLNSSGEVAEGAISNIFFFSNGSWHTPALNCGPLPGVIRGALLKSLPVVEGAYPLEGVLTAEAVFLSNASMGLQAVDYLLLNGQKMPRQSSQHSCLPSARQRLAKYIEGGSIQFS